MSDGLNGWTESSKPKFGDRVEFHDGEAWRVGRVVDEMREYGITSLSDPRGQVVAVRVWIDGAIQPETEMRPASTVRIRP